MTISVSMLAPVAGGVYFAKSGTSYTASNADKVIPNVVPGDIDSLTQLGCIIISQRPFNSITVSSAAGQYVAEGAINTIAASTMTVPLLLGTVSLPGATTSFVSLSTGNTTITSSGVTILDEKSVACTVLTAALGVLDLRSISSTLYQIVNRSIASNSSNALVYGITSS